MPFKQNAEGKWVAKTIGRRSSKSAPPKRLGVIEEWGTLAMQVLDGTVLQEADLREAMAPFAELYTAAAPVGAQRHGAGPPKPTEVTTDENGKVVEDLALGRSKSGAHKSFAFNGAGEDPVPHLKYDGNGKVTLGDFDALMGAFIPQWQGFAYTGVDFDAKMMPNKTMKLMMTFGSTRGVDKQGVTIEGTQKEGFFILNNFTLDPDDDSKIKMWSQEFDKKYHKLVREHVDTQDALAAASKMRVVTEWAEAAKAMMNAGECDAAPMARGLQKTESLYVDIGIALMMATGAGVTGNFGTIASMIVKAWTGFRFSGADFKVTANEDGTHTVVQTMKRTVGVSTTGKEVLGTSNDHFSITHEFTQDRNGLIKAHTQTLSENNKLFFQVSRGKIDAAK